MFLPRPDPNNEPRTPFDFFSLLIPTTFYTEIAEQTYLFARQRGADETTFTPTNADEIRAFIGLSMYMNIHVLPSLKLYWSEKSPFYASYVTKTKPRNRFEKLSKYTCIWTTERRRLTRADKGTTRCTRCARSSRWHNKPSPSTTPFLHSVNFIVWMYSDLRGPENRGCLCVCLSVCVSVCVSECLCQLYSLNCWAEFDEISQKMSRGHGPVLFFSDFGYLNLMTSWRPICIWRSDTLMVTILVQFCLNVA